MPHLPLARISQALAAPWRSRPQPEQAPAGPPSRWRQALPFLAAGLLTLGFLTLPVAPPDNEGDPSLSAVLNYAHEHRLQFGTELVYTYGPLGFLIFPYFSAHAAVTRMAVAVALGYTVAAGLCLAAWRRSFWGTLPLVLFAWVAANIQYRIDLLIDVGLLCWGLLCFVESGRRLVFCIVTFTALAALVALAKASFLFVTGISILLLACELLSRRQSGAAVGLLAGFCAAFCLGWMLAGQNLLHLGVFLARALAVVRGYHQALGWEAWEMTARLGLALALLLAVLVPLRSLTAFGGHEPRVRWRRVWLFAWVTLLTFTVWKHGFVRGDVYHAVFFLGFVPALALALEAVPGGAVRLARGVGLLACLLALVTSQIFFFPACLESLKAPVAAVRDNLRSLLAPGDYLRRMHEALEEQRRLAQLPVSRQIIGSATADLFGQCQAYLLFNDLNYRLRPVFQSYVACSAALMRLNERFFLSRAAPSYVLFELGPLDRKFPPLEDAWVLRDLLINYAPVGVEGRFVLLKAKSSDAPRLTLLREGVVGPGEPIDLRAYGAAALWLELELRPTWPGRLRQFLYRPPTVRLAAWGEPGKRLILRRRAPPSMLAAGFLASPLLVRNEDVLNVYGTNAPTRPAACSVELLPGEEHLWQSAIHFRISKIENPLGR